MTGGLVGGSSAHATEHPIPERENIMAKKAPNYTDEMVVAITESYQAGTPLEEIAEAIGKSVKSVRSKLICENVWIPVEKKAKKPKKPTKKELFNRLEEIDPNAPIDGLKGAKIDAIAWIIDTAEAAADNG